jgi:hypothetical protein
MGNNYLRTNKREKQSSWGQRTGIAVHAPATLNGFPTGQARIGTAGVDSGSGDRGVGEPLLTSGDAAAAKREAVAQASFENSFAKAGQGGSASAPPTRGSRDASVPGGDNAPHGPASLQAPNANLAPYFGARPGGASTQAPNGPPLSSAQQIARGASPSDAFLPSAVKDVIDAKTAATDRLAQLTF